MVQVASGRAMEDLQTVAERHKGFCVHRLDFAESIRLRDQLLPDPGKLFRKGRLLSGGRTGMLRDWGIVRVDGRDYFIKRYNCLGWGYRIKHLPRPSRALRAWRAGLQLLHHGLATPLPLLCIEKRHLRLLGEAYLVCPCIEGAQQLLDLWPRLSSDEKRDYLFRLAEDIAAMHRHHFCHGDINWRNIMVQKEGAEVKFYFIDLDGSKFAGELTAERGKRDVGHFIRDLRRCGGEQELEELFLQQWRKQSGLFSVSKSDDLN